MVRASPLRGIAPSRYGVGSSACLALFLRPHAHHRPHVSISWALPQALASCGILPNTPSGWHLLTTTRESTCRVTPFPVPIVASVGRCSPPGFCGSAHRSVSKAAGALSCAFWLQRVSLLRWLAFTMAHYTFAYAAHRCLRDGIPGVRLPGSAVYPRFRPLRTSRRPGGYAVTPAPGGRDLHPHGELSYTAFNCAVCPRILVLFRPTGRTSMKAVLICQPHAANTCWTASKVPNTT